MHDLMNWMYKVEMENDGIKYQMKVAYGNDLFSQWFILKTQHSFF